MYVTLVQVHVKPDKVKDFIEASVENARESIKEPGNVRFDVLQSAEDPTRFVLYEAYVTRKDAAAHKDTPHYQKWKAIVAEWMAEPRVGIPYKGLFPAV